MLDDKPEPVPLGQAGNGVTMHGCGMSELMGRTTTLSASHPFVSRNNLVALHNYSDGWSDALSLGCIGLLNPA